MRQRGTKGMRFGSTLLMGLLAGIAVSAAAVDDTSDAYQPSTVDLTLPKGVSKTLLPTHAKITDSLYAVANEIRGKVSKGGKALEDLKRASVSNRANPIFRLDKNGRSIQVHITLSSTSDDAVSQLEAAGLQVEYVSNRRPVAQGWISLSKLESLAELKIVHEIRLPSYAIPTGSGQVTTEGEYLGGLPYIRRRTPRGETEPVLVDGSGVTVAVISTSLFRLPFLPAQPCGPLQVHVASNRGEDGAFLFDPSDLPSPENCSDSVPTFGQYGSIRVSPVNLDAHVLDDSQFNADTPVPYPEGSAMLEVIHDLAPKAELRYGQGLTTLGLEANRQFLVESLQPKPDVVVENVVFVGEGRYDGSSAPSRQATEYARERNIHYFVSVGGVTPQGSTSVVEAGRFPLQISDHFRGDPRNNRSRVHSWSQGVTENRDEGLNVTGDADNPIDVTLVWDDEWDDADPVATFDFDMYLVPRSTLSISQAVAASVRVQNGDGSNPIERVVFFPQPSTPPLSLVIVREDGTENSRTLFTLVIESGTVEEPEYLTHGVPLNNSDALAPVVSVGEVDITQDFQLSRWAIPGATPGNPNVDRFFKWFESQDAPTVVSYSGVRTRTTDFFPPPVLEDLPPGFSGPSASAAHVAGFAALLRHRFPEMPTYRLGELLSDTSGLDDEGNPVIPFATDVTPEETKEFKNHPVYRRPNPWSLYLKLDEGVVDPYGFPPSEIKLPKPSFDEVLVADSEVEGLGETIHGAMDLENESPDGWSPVSTGSSSLDITEMGLRIAGGGGAWSSPLLTIQTPDDSEPRTTLRTDRMYLLEARVGSNETDPLKVPDFRLAVESAGADEVWSLTVANNSDGIANAPTTLGGKVYQVFFTPSTPEIAKEGFTFVFERLENSADDSEDAILILRDLTLRELPLPEDPTDLP